MTGHHFMEARKLRLYYKTLHSPERFIRLFFGTINANDSLVRGGERQWEATFFPFTKESRYASLRLLIRVLHEVIL